MKAFITRTVRKDIDYINGMRVTIKGWNEDTQAVRVETVTGKIFDITKWLDRDLNDMLYYPLRIGYASTILRMAGAELQHVTLYLDVAHAAGAAYTALSRVSSIDKVKLGGPVLKPYFAPCRP